MRNFWPTGKFCSWSISTLRIVSFLFYPSSDPGVLLLIRAPTSRWRASTHLLAALYWLLATAHAYVREPIFLFQPHQFTSLTLTEGPELYSRRSTHNHQGGGQQ
jgi:hypothetical protein